MQILIYGAFAPTAKAWITSTCPHPEGHGQVKVTHPRLPPFNLKLLFGYGYKCPSDWIAGYFPPVGGRHESARGEVQGQTSPFGRLYITIRASNAKNGCSPILAQVLPFWYMHHRACIHAPPCIISPPHRSWVILSNTI